MPLVLIGAGHVFDIAAPIEAIIEHERPGVVALELDQARFQGLLQRASGDYDPQQALRTAPLAYRAMAKYQERLAESLGAAVGGEMLAAARAAKRVNARVELVDVNAQELVQRLWKEMGLLEKMRLGWEALTSKLPGKKKGSIDEELQRYHKDPAAYLTEVGKTHPSLKRVLVDERNEHMASRIRRLVTADQSVVAVVGDGHVDGMSKLLADLAPKIVRLDELRRRTKSGLQWSVSPGRDRTSFSFEQWSPEGTFERSR